MLKIYHLEMMASQKNFTKRFGKKKKIPLSNIITKSYQNGELSTSQRQAVIKLIEKRIRTIN